MRGPLCKDHNLSDTLTYGGNRVTISLRVHSVLSVAPPSINDGLAALRHACYQLVALLRSHIIPGTPDGLLECNHAAEVAWDGPVHKFSMESMSGLMAGNGSLIIS